MNIKKFKEQVWENALYRPKVNDEILKVTNIICYEAAMKVEDINFEIPIKAFEGALEELKLYVADEIIDLEEDEEFNKYASITELNRIAHLIQEVNRCMKEKRKSRSFFI